MKIAVVGTGYVGLVTGTCLAETGNTVTCVDINQEKVNKLKNGIIPIYEPHLDALFERNIKDGRLFFTTDLASAIKDAKVIFLGKLRDTSHVLSFSDLFLLPSETESFGLAALEAMALGVPVISSNTGGIPEVNEHGFSGFLSDVGDVEDMAKNALIVLSDSELIKFKTQAKQKATDFTIEKILPLYEKIYLKLV